MRKHEKRLALRARSFLHRVVREKFPTIRGKRLMQKANVVAVCYRVTGLLMCATECRADEAYSTRSRSGRKARNRARGEGCGHPRGSVPRPGAVVGLLSAGDPGSVPGEGEGEDAAGAGGLEGGGGGVQGGAGGHDVVHDEDAAPVGAGEGAGRDIPRSVPARNTRSSTTSS